MVEFLYWLFWFAVFAGLVKFCWWLIFKESAFWGVIVFVVVGVLLAALCLALYDELFIEHPTFTLRTDRWSCTQRHTEVQTIYISGPKGQMTPMVTSNVVCDQYTAR